MGGSTGKLSRRVRAVNSDGTLTPELMAVNPESIVSRAKWKRSPTVRLRDTAMHGGHWGGGCWPPTDDEPLIYQFGAPPFLNLLWIPHSIKGRHNGESLFSEPPPRGTGFSNLLWQRIPAAISIINTVLPIISAEPALFGVYADDLFSRWRALRGFRNTLKR